MINPSLTAKLKRAAIAGMTIALLITSGMLLMRPAPRQDATIATAINRTGTGAGHSPASLTVPDQAAPADDHLASVTVIILNNGKTLPLAIKAGDQYIEIPGPAAWPKAGKSGPGDAETGRFLAGIVDTADILRANGLRADAAFSFVVGGTALNASNTFRIAGNHHPDAALERVGGYAEEFNTQDNEEGIWRTLKFKNIVLSYGQVPSLADFLVAPPSGAVTTPLVAQANRHKTAEPLNATPAEMADKMREEEQETQKFLNALNDPDPTIRAQGIQNLILYGNSLARDPSGQGIATYLEKALTDSNAAVREAGLHSLDIWDGDIPLQSLSNIVLNDQDPQLRIHALNLLAERFDEKAVPTLQQASHDPDPQVAQRAAQLLSTYVQP